jgi:hypothetical protein
MENESLGKNNKIANKLEVHGKANKRGSFKKVGKTMTVCGFLSIILTKPLFLDTELKMNTSLYNMPLGGIRGI